MTKKKSLEWHNCSEEQLIVNVQKWLKSPEPGTAIDHNSILFLNGEMGAGKSTFARALLSQMVPHFQSKGSPTFPLVNTYQAPSAVVYHIDLYRLKSDLELEDSGILQQIEEPGAFVMVEWADQFPEVFTYWRTNPSHNKSKKVIEVTIDQASALDFRNIKIVFS